MSQAQVPGDGNDFQHQAALAAVFPPYFPAASLKPVLPSSGKLPCPCPPCSAVSRQLLSLKTSCSFLKTILFLISCPGTRPCSISPVQMAAHGISVSYLQGSDIGWTPQGFLYKHQWKREDNTYLHPSLGSSFVPTDAPAQQSDAC